ncbi:hypothetical protein J8273_7538 [Carpediemonas membranifera]|uniref:Uncharacterized protein n=1 Tax=Carpediemonas membranifera TaxID=201153 RepID=A0A8J6AZW9_9EUKA|nr:hypothetical protein J8273_7538 [Carpediemonas membranifera]|eukprot:KAG9391264.1 hypothetical protein J8273_7538 [Carpediemonas membranifera]
MMPTDGKIDIKEGLMSAYTCSLTVAADVTGDVPSLIRHAYSRHFESIMPSVQRSEPGEQSVASSCSELADLIARIPPLSPSAQTHLDCASRALRGAAPVSMNFQLDAGDELPVALHTLLQGTVWAILMEAGADPDLERSESEAASVRVQYKDADKCLWFLCKKFRFCHQVVEKDGVASSTVFKQLFKSSLFAGVCYHGRVFTIASFRVPARYSRLRVPPVVKLHGLGTAALLLVTVGGIYGIDYTEVGKAIQFDRLCERGMTAPVRASLDHCPKVAEFEKGLPRWQKHKLAVDASIVSCDCCVIMTPVGVVAAGTRVDTLVGIDIPHDEQRSFHTVPMPTGFVPDHIMTVGSTIVFSMDDRQMIAGDNSSGQLGLGDDTYRLRPAPLPFRVDHVISTGFTNFYLSGASVLLAGNVDPLIAQTGLLPSRVYTESCHTATPLEFPKDPLQAFLFSQHFAVAVCGSETLLFYFLRKDPIIVTLSFPATAAGMYSKVTPHDTSSAAFRSFGSFGSFGASKTPSRGVCVEGPDGWVGVLLEEGAVPEAVEGDPDFCEELIKVVGEV